MGTSAPVVTRERVAPEPRQAPRPAVPPQPFRFYSLVESEPHSLVKPRSATASLSLVVHAVLIAAAVIVPLFMEDVLPIPDETLRAFFVAPVEVAPPPPPPPPPPAGVRSAHRAPAAPQPAPDAKFVAPVEIPAEILPEESLDLGLIGGVPGGVEGGVPGGVVGGVVGGLPQTVVAPPPPPKVVRVGGAITPPQLIKRVQPKFPVLAEQARLSGIVIIEAYVDVHGRVKSTTVLRGAPLFDEPAVEAVKQWRYKPLLLNGQPTEFIVVVTVMFNLKAPGEQE